MSQGYCFVIGSVCRCGFVARCSDSTSEDVGACLDFTLNSEHVDTERRVHQALFERTVYHRETMFNCSPKRCQNLFSHHDARLLACFDEASLLIVVRERQLGIVFAFKRLDGPFCNARPHRVS